MRALSNPRPSGPASLNSQAAVVERLAGVGIGAEMIVEAIALLKSGRADLIEAVLGGGLTVPRALKIAKRGRP